MFLADLGNHACSNAGSISTLLPVQGSMRICTMLLISLVLIGAALAIALAESTEQALGAGGSDLLQAETEGNGYAAQSRGGVPQGPSSSLSLTGRLWAPTNSVPSSSKLWARPQPPRSFALGPGPNGPRLPPPGIYESEPYKCIVVVPGAQWDDRCLVPGGDSTAPMPVHKPELRLVPRPNR